MNEDKPASDKQLKFLVSLGYNYEDIRNCSMNEAKGLIQEKLGNTATTFSPRSSPGWRNEPQKPQNEPVSQPKGVNGARIGCAVNNAVNLIVATKITPLADEKDVKQMIKRVAKDILQVMDELEAGK